jgi:hypothetical protein
LKKCAVINGNDQRLPYYQHNIIIRAILVIFIIELTNSATAQDWERASTGGSTVAAA